MNLLNERETAERLGMSVKSLQKWRWLGIGLRYVKFNKSVRYDEGDIRAYIEAHLVTPHNGEAA